MGRHRTEERMILIRLKTKRPERISVMLLQRRLNLKRRKKMLTCRELRTPVELVGKSSH